jgi:hypothetical protein
MSTEKYDPGESLDNLHKECTVEVSQARAYHFRFQPFGWAIFTLNDSTNEFTIQSDWGNYCFRWPRAGVGHESPPMENFIVGCHPEYIARKFSQDLNRQEVKQFNLEETKKSFREEIIRMRKETVRDGFDHLDAERARQAWEALDWICRRADDYGGEAASVIMYDNWPDELGMFNDELHEWFIYTDTPRFKFLVEKLLPFFQTYLRGRVV